MELIQSLLNDKQQVETVQESTKRFAQESSYLAIVREIDKAFNVLNRHLVGETRFKDLANKLGEETFDKSHFKDFKLHLDALEDTFRDLEKAVGTAIQHRNDPYND